MNTACCVLDVFVSAHVHVPPHLTLCVRVCVFVCVCAGTPSSPTSCGLSPPRSATQVGGVGSLCSAVGCIPSSVTCLPALRQPPHHNARVQVPEHRPPPRPDSAVPLRRLLTSACSAQSQPSGVRRHQQAARNDRVGISQLLAAAGISLCCTPRTRRAALAVRRHAAGTACDTLRALLSTLDLHSFASWNLHPASCPILLPPCCSGLQTRKVRTGPAVHSGMAHV